MDGVSKPRLSMPKASSCHTLSVTTWCSGDCNTNPISDDCRRLGTSCSGTPSKKIPPSAAPWGASTDLHWRSSVDLPQPDGPHSTQNCPGRTVSDISSSALRRCWG